VSETFPTCLNTVSAKEQRTHFNRGDMRFLKNQILSSGALRFCYTSGLVPGTSVWPRVATSLQYLVRKANGGYHVLEPYGHRCLSNDRQTSVSHPRFQAGTQRLLRFLEFPDQRRRSRATVRTTLVVYLRGFRRLVGHLLLTPCSRSSQGLGVGNVSWFRTVVALVLRPAGKRPSPLT
jgi:hypothetical protein